MLPIVIRLPANVLETANVYHSKALAGSRNLIRIMTAGTLLTILLSRADMAARRGRLSILMSLLIMRPARASRNPC